jgi:hypothetical protein
MRCTGPWCSVDKQEVDILGPSDRPGIWSADEKAAPLAEVDV